MAAVDLDFQAVPFLGGIETRLTFNLYDGTPKVDIAGDVTLRQAIEDGLAKRHGWLAKFPFEIVEKACEDDDVDLDRTRVVFLEEG